MWFGRTAVLLRRRRRMFLLLLHFVSLPARLAAPISFFPRRPALVISVFLSKLLVFILPL